MAAWLGLLFPLDLWGAGLHACIEGGAEEMDMWWKHRSMHGKCSRGAKAEALLQFDRATNL